MDHNPFDEILDLEEQFYNEGYQQGLADGVKAGRIEGRTFGLEKGFEKYIESARLHGKSLVWANRVPELHSVTLPGTGTSGLEISKNTNESDIQPLALPQLPKNPRLAKHIKVLYALAESESLPTENTEEAVTDFDDRLRRAQAKTKVIERMIGEVEGEVNLPGTAVSSKDGSIEDASIPKA